jgi:hypothetical protein
MINRAQRKERLPGLISNENLTLGSGAIWNADRSAAKIGCRYGGTRCARDSGTHELQLERPILAQPQIWLLERPKRLLARRQWAARFCGRAVARSAPGLGDPAAGEHGKGHAPPANPVASAAR